MKTIKKIIALATGAIMLGATITGAVAADLADYPAPFVEGCAFSGVIVVGEKAAAEDVVGAVDIASSLAVSGTTTTSAGTGTTVTVSGEAYKVEKSSDKLNMGDLLSSVQTVSIDDEDLPTVLADGVFTNDEGNEYEYEQEIDLGGTLTLTHFSDNDFNDDDPSVGIEIGRNTEVLNYTLEFTKNAKSDIDADDQLPDFEDTTIVMLGNTYDIVEANNDGGVVTLELMGGAIKDVMEQGEVKSFTVNDKEYEVEITYIGGTTSKVKLKVNGEVTKALEEGDTAKLADGTQIGIREILEEEAGEVTADQVEFYIGAEKLTLVDGAELEVNDEDIDNMNVDITSTNTSTELELDDITIQWIADDDLFIAEDSSITMPGLESVKLSFEGLTIGTEEVTQLEPDGDNQIELTVNVKGGEVTFPLYNATGNVWTVLGGENSDEGIVATCTAGCIVDRDTDMFFIASDNNSQETHFVEVTKVDDTDGVSFKDLASGSTYEDRKAAAAFDIGDVTVEIFNFDEAGDWVNLTLTATTAEDDEIYTDEGLTIHVGAASIAATQVITFVEEDDNENLDKGTSFTVTLNVATDATVSATSVTTIEIQPDTDDREGYVVSALATRVVHDTGGDQDSIDIYYHGEEIYGNMFVSEVEAGFGKAEGMSGEAVCKVSIPPAKLDSEVASVSAQNLLIVGGPCVNTAAAEVMGNPAVCTEGFEEGKAMIKLLDTGAGKTAMLVAGFSAMDTRRATRVVANSGDYALSGDEVSVTGTTLSDISVSVVE